MKITSVMRTAKFVRIIHEAKGPVVRVPNPEKPGEVTEHQGTENRKTTAYELPLASFDKSLQALADVAVNILELGADYTKGLEVISLGISYSKSGVRSATITFSKALDATGTTLQMHTPAFQIDDGATPDQGRRQCSPAHAKAVAKMITEAQKYADGERQQQTFGWEKEAARDNAEPQGGQELPLGGQAPAGGEAPPAETPPPPASDAKPKKPRKPRAPKTTGQ